jgi:hypothetical protein
MFSTYINAFFQKILLFFKVLWAFILATDLLLGVFLAKELLPNQFLLRLKHFYKTRPDRI